jgi:dUTP pyrophosphatase
METLSVKLMTLGARAPERASQGAAGYDLFASEAAEVPPGGGRALVSTGLAMRPPADTYVRIAPRSGLAVKHGIAVGAGVVDEDYRGIVKVLLFNHGTEAFCVSQGDRIAQAVVERIATPPVLVLGPAEDLDHTERGAGGFGSTGK